ncbi:uncharacterized protein LOC105662189 isoform X2 [Megachile rotundata]|uniref:uncharacterized protein LOC105662189 isoform X2 n=1 Tax=Megachile rotundata TaxID=143995 RepID=UPI003FD53BCB
MLLFSSREIATRSHMVMCYMYDLHIQQSQPGYANDCSNATYQAYFIFHATIPDRNSCATPIKLCPKVEPKQSKLAITMKLLSVLRVSLITTFYCVSVISSVKCDARTSQNEPIADPKSSTVNTSQAGREIHINDIVKLLRLLEKNFDQLTARKQVSEVLGPDDDLKNKVSGDHVDAEQSLQRLFRREAPDNSSADSDSSSKNQAAVNETSDSTKSNADSSQERNVKTDNPFLANLFKNGFLGNVEAGSPLQPVKQILGFPRKLFERGKNVLNTVKENAEGLAPVGIHRTLKLGPWSVNFDMGKP